jgi:FkbM family methyltransferase
MRKAYFWWARPSDGIVRFSAAGTPVEFYVRTPGELRNLDPAGEGQQEHRIIQLLMSALVPGDTVLDVGSNVGLYAVLFAKTVGLRGTVIALEPEPECYQHLLDNLRLNRLANIRAFQKALGNTTGQMKLYHGPENGDSSLVVPTAEKDTSYVVVDVVEGDRFLETENLPAPRAVKIDVEGFEYSALEGLKNTLQSPSCELLCCEIHPKLLPREVSSADIVSFVRLLGFVQTEILRRYDTLHLIGWKGTGFRLDQRSQ